MTVYGGTDLEKQAKGLDEALTSSLEHPVV